ncbi:MAG: hypothetical protein ACOCVR_05000 [Myxococcota bacterium]
MIATRSQSPLLLLALLPLSLLLSASCAGTTAATRSEPGLQPTQGAFFLLEEIEGIPSEVLAERSPREDLYVQTTTGSPVPSEITSGQTPELLITPGMRVSLAGDEQGEKGWTVNNLVLFEVFVEGEVVDRFAVGFHEPLYMGRQMIESVGAYSPRFEARTPIITQRLPVGVPFVLRATALDYRTLGAVSSLWLIIENQEAPEGFRELRDDGIRR